jgi:hypothetical protein
MILERLALAASLSACLGSCSLDPPPAPRAIDCESDRAAERYPETCDDAGEEPSSDGGQ